MLDQPRSTQRYEPRRAKDEAALLRELHALSRQHPRYGYRRLTHKLRRQGWRINPKRVARLMRQEGLRVPQRTRKRRRLGSSENGCVRRQATRPHEVWAIDFLMDQTADGRRLKLLPIVDEASRACLSIRVARRLRAQDVIEELERLMVLHGAPAFIRSDNGPEFIAVAVRAFLEEAGVGTLFIEPGAPWQNAYAESFNSRLRDEVLNLEWFASCEEARVLIERYRREYNLERPHSGLGYRTPLEVLESTVGRVAVGAPS